MIRWLKRLIWPEIFDLEKVDGPLTDKAEHFEWISRGLGYFSGDIRDIRKFYLVFTLESGQNYRINDPILIEKSVDLNGGSINIVFPSVEATKECCVMEYRVYDKDDNFLILREAESGFRPTVMNPRDSINFDYRITI